MSKVLVTGGLGYIGSRLTDYLGYRGFECAVADPGLFASALLYPAPEVSVIRQDVRSIHEQDLEDIESVIHLAGISNDPVGELTDHEVYNATLNYSLDLATMCKKMGVRFIFASSCSVYGIRQEVCSEDTEPNPQTGYSLNKLQVEQALSAIADASFKPVALRFGTIFGISPRIRFDVVINMLVGMAVTTGKIVLNSDGQSWRPHLHIDDACEAIYQALCADFEGESLATLNVGGKTCNARILDVARQIKGAVLGSSIEMPDSATIENFDLVKDRKVSSGVDPRTYQVSFEKIRRFLPNFRCKWTIEEGIEDMARRLSELRVDKELFQRRSFYRLQHLEDLKNAGKISEEFWLS